MIHKILIVDDDHDSRSALSLVLSCEGFDVVEASDGREALVAIVREVPDLVLMDLMMPVMNGWQLLHQLRHSPRYARLPVVVLSSVDAHGRTDFLQKPVSIDRLLAVMRTAYARAHAQATPALTAAEG